MTGIEVPTGLLIGGQWGPGRGGRGLSVVDPATEDSVADVADASVEDALDAVGAAYQALPGWAATPPRERAECLRRAPGLMMGNAEAPGRLMGPGKGEARRGARVA